MNRTQRITGYPIPYGRTKNAITIFCIDYDSRFNTELTRSVRAAVANNRRIVWTTSLQGHYGKGESQYTISDERPLGGNIAHYFRFHSFMILSLSILCYACGYERQQVHPKFTCSVTISPNGGWGYRIYRDSIPFIDQQEIPAVPGVSGFKTRDDASKVANLILMKLRSHPSDLPAVTLEDLDSLGVSYQKPNI
jgi:hypothetical protein